MTSMKKAFVLSALFQLAQCGTSDFEIPDGFSKAEPEPVAEPVEESTSLDPMLRVADGTAPMAFGQQQEFSQCGIHRDCMSCGRQRGCNWMPGFGCTAGYEQNTCSPFFGLDALVAQPCDTYSDCKKCTTQNGCVWAFGSCAYSQGTACLNDPVNCANYKWQCPAKDKNEKEPSLLDVLIGQQLGATVSSLGPASSLLDVNIWSATNNKTEEAGGGLTSSASMLCRLFHRNCNPSALDPYLNQNAAVNGFAMSGLSAEDRAALTLANYMNQPAPYTGHNVWGGSPVGPFGRGYTTNYGSNYGSSYGSSYQRGGQRQRQNFGRHVGQQRGQQRGQVSYSAGHVMPYQSVQQSVVRPGGYPGPGYSSPFINGGSVVNFRP